MNTIRNLLISAAVLGIAACSTGKSEQPKLDYQTVNHKVVDLEVPPDLANPSQGNLYQLPAGSGAVRASDLDAPTAVRTNPNAPVLTDVQGIHLQRDGSQRWLEISGKTPAEIWPLLKAFWQESGFVILNEEPAIGQMETEWAENRAKIPVDALRSLFEKFGIGGVYSTSERDKFIIRIENGKNGTVDVFFVHKGMEEVYTDSKKDNTIWQPRPNDPNLEAAFLSRFMQYLGADEKKVADEINRTQSAAANTLAKLDGNSVLVFGDHQRNWTRIGLSLERIGLSIQGMNTEKHAFLVKAAPNESDSVRNNKPGFFSRIFGKKTEASNETLPELIVYAEPVENGTRVLFLNRDGSPYQGREAAAWREQLYKELH